MKLIAVINGWTEAPALWRDLIWPPLSIRRMPVIAEEQGELILREFPVVYGVRALGIVLVLELNRGWPA